MERESLSEIVYLCSEEKDSAFSRQENDTKLIATLPAILIRSIDLFKSLRDV